MPRKCTICIHPERTEIEKILVTRAESYRGIARQFDLSQAAVSRHVNDGHIAERLAKVHDEEEALEALDVLRQLRAINSAAGRILQEAMDKDENGIRRSPLMALRAMDRVHRQLELQAKLLGVLSDAPQIDIHAHPEWIQIKATIRAALAPFPEAQESLLSALGEVRNGRG